MARSKNGHGAAVLEFDSADFRDAAEDSVLPQLDTHSATAMQMDNLLDEAGRQVVHKQLQKLEKAHKTIEENQDPEAIHDMRVATRRLRTALKILEETIEDPKLMDYYRKGLHKIMDRLSRVRDADVLREQLESYRSNQQPAAADLQVLEQKLSQEREFALLNLHKILQKRKTQHLLHDLERFARKTESQAMPLGHDPYTVEPAHVRDFVGSQLWQSYEGVLAYQRVLTEPQNVSVTTLHRLRIAIKRLRYTLEFFAEALPSQVSALIHQLGGLQDYLGNLHDHAVAVNETQAVLAEQAENVALHTYRDMRASKRDQMQREFASKWAEINSTNFRQNLSLLLV